MHTPNGSTAPTRLSPKAACPGPEWWGPTRRGVLGVTLSVMRAPVAIGAALVVMLVLLVALHQVVARVVAQGEMRRQAVATLERQTWQCKQLATRSERESCLLHLVAVPRDSASLRPQRELRVSAAR